MAQLWMQDQSSGAEWAVLPLNDGAFALAPDAGPPVRPRRDGTDCAGAALLLRSRGPQGEAWLVMCATPGTLAPDANQVQQCTASGPAQCVEVPFDFPTDKTVTGTLPG